MPRGVHATGQKWMIGRLITASIALLLIVADASAQTRTDSGRTFPVPKRNPAFTISIPTSWKVDEIDFGFSALSPDKNVKFFAEYTSEENVERLLATNDAWM